MFNLFKNKQNKRDKFLLKEFEEGRILHVDEDIDNKEVFKTK